MLQIRDLVKIYPGPVAALQGVSLDIPGGMFGLLGPNGAGKSTLMRILAGVLEPTSGAVRLDDVDVLTDTAKLRASLGYLPQDFGFFPHLSGQAMLEIGAVRGERFPADSTKEQGAPYAQSLATITLGSKEKGTVKIRSAFEPERVVVDPDVRVLQLRRKLAERAIPKR